MGVPDMQAHLVKLVGKTVYTVAEGSPNTIERVTDTQAFIRTPTTQQRANRASILELQDIADRVWAGEVVTVEARGRSAFHMAVLCEMPGVAFALRPRRVWLTDNAPLDVELDDVLDGAPAALEGRIIYRRHRLRERSPALARDKKQQALAASGRLACEVCDADFTLIYGELGDGFIECHHRKPLADGAEVETTLGDLALVCSNCHRMLHRRLEVLDVDTLRRMVLERRAG